MFLRGLILGFSIAAPVGPIGILCIRRTLANGKLIGLISGLGAATADFIYGCIAAFGLTVVTGVLVDYRDAIRLVGGLFLFYLGVKIFRAKPAESNAEPEKTSLVGAYSTTLFLTLTNPMTILSFTAIFAGAGLATHSSNAVWLVLGVFFGSALWWLFLSTGTGLFHKRISTGLMAWINRFSGALILAFAVYSLSGLVF